MLDTIYRYLVLNHIPGGLFAPLLALFGAYKLLILSNLPRKFVLSSTISNFSQSPQLNLKQRLLSTSLPSIWRSHNSISSISTFQGRSSSLALHFTFGQQNTVVRTVLIISNDGEVFTHQRQILGRTLHGHFAISPLKVMAFTKKS